MRNEPPWKVQHKQAPARLHVSRSTRLGPACDNPASFRSRLSLTRMLLDCPCRYRLLRIQSQLKFWDFDSVTKDIGVSLNCFSPLCNVLSRAKCLSCKETLLQRPWHEPSERGREVLSDVVMQVLFLVTLALIDSGLHIHFIICLSRPRVSLCRLRYLCQPRKHIRAIPVLNLCFHTVFGHVCSSSSHAFTHFI